MSRSKESQKDRDTFLPRLMRSTKLSLYIVRWEELDHSFFVCELGGQSKYITLIIDMLMREAWLAVVIDIFKGWHQHFYPIQEKQDDVMHDNMSDFTFWNQMLLCMVHIFSDVVRIRWEKVSQNYSSMLWSRALKGKCWLDSEVHSQYPAMFKNRYINQACKGLFTELKN